MPFADTLPLPLLRLVALSVAVLTSAACTSSATGGNASSGGPGFDCAALRDKQSAAHCPKFDANQYMLDCQDTKSRIPAGCTAKADALANCLLGQPITCTDAGAVNDDTPAACRSLESDLQSCK